MTAQPSEFAESPESQATNTAPGYPPTLRDALGPFVAEGEREWLEYTDEPDDQSVSLRATFGQMRAARAALAASVDSPTLREALDEVLPLVVRQQDTGTRTKQGVAIIALYCGDPACDQPGGLPHKPECRVAQARAALAAAPEREFGYEDRRNGYDSNCTHCGEPPSSHACPMVADPPPCEGVAQAERH